jgi:UDP-N-acetylmuramate--alanine ligase
MPAKKLKIHFIGIGGIGVSALAQYYLAKGCKVSGSDLAPSEITQALKNKGATVKIGPHKKENVPKGADLLIYSPAVQKANPELAEAEKLKIRCLGYPEALGELTKQHYTIAVSGTHGKSTTTAMLGLLLVRAGLDPTVIVGTKLKEFKDGNCRVGKSKYLVIEADEHFASFLNYWPKIIALTNIEADHLDYYKNLNNLLRSFKQYVSHLPECGVLVVNADDKNIRKILKGRTSFKVKSYSLRQPEAKRLKKILRVPGRHNIYNALEALTVARVLGVPDRLSFKALSEYEGAWRRFEIVQTKPFVLVSDYGHNPTKAMAGFETAREKYPKKRIWCVYQPHQYQRTYYLFKDFVRVFRQAPIDRIIITDIYDVAGREEGKIKKRVSSEKLVEAVNRKNVIYLPRERIINYVKGNLKEVDVLIMMGAGDIYSLVDPLRKL